MYRSKKYQKINVFELPEHRDKEVEEHDGDNEEVHHQEHLRHVSVDVAVVQILEHSYLSEHGFKYIEPHLNTWRSTHECVNNNHTDLQVLGRCGVIGVLFSDQMCVCV